MERPLGWDNIKQMVTTFDSIGIHTPWGLSRKSMKAVKTLWGNNPTFVRADLLLQATRFWAEWQNQDLARAKPNMIGRVTEISTSIKAPTIEEPKLTQQTNKHRGPSTFPETSTTLPRWREQSR